MVHSRNHCCNRNATIFVCIVELQCHCQEYGNTHCCTKMHLWCTYVAGNNKTYIHLVMWSTRYSCTILSKYGVSPPIFIWSPISNFVKISSVGAVLIHADRRMEMTKLRGGFHDYANAPKMSRANCKSCLKLQYWLRTPLQPCLHQVWICESRRSHCV